MAQSRKRMPVFDPGSTHDLVRRLGMSFPSSIKDLLATLNSLPPDSVTFSSGRNVTGTVHWSGTLFLQSDGGSAFSGQVHESGPVGDKFVMAIALLDVKDALGRPLVLPHEDTIIGQLEIGFSDKEWNTPGGIPAVADNWEQVKATRVQWKMHTSTDPWQVLETVVVAMFAAIGSIFVGTQAATCPEGQHWGDGHWVNTGPPYDSTPGDPGRPPGGEDGGGHFYRVECVPDVQ